MKGYKGIGMEGFVARSYDKNVKQLNIKQYKNWANKIVKIVPERGRILDVATGPGYLPIELAKAGNFEVTGLDISETFVGIAKKNAGNEDLHIKFLKGDISNSPFEDKSFDLVTCTSAFKNFSQPVIALNEMYRILDDNGKVWICDMRNDITTENINNYVDSEMKAEGFTALYMKLTFRYMLKKRAYTKEEFERFISKTKFKDNKIVENPVGFEIFLNK